MSRNPIGKFALFALLGSVACGFLHALPRLGALPGSNDLLSAARGLASSENIPGFLSATLDDRIAGWLWRTGGPGLLGAGLWFDSLLRWTLLPLFVLIGVRWIARSFPRARAPVFGLAIAGLLATCIPPVLRALNERESHAATLRLIAPVELADAVKDLKKEELFANATAWPHLLLLAPQFAGAVSPEDAARLSRKPAAWRDALRTNRWNTVLLTGPTPEYLPLLAHLLESPDWRLAMVTNAGFLFRRGEGPAAPPVDVAEFQLSSPEETAVYLSQIAEYYEAIRRTADARACLDRALELAPDNVTVLSRAASHAASRKRWRDAIALSDRALARHPGFLHAKIVKALALAETGEPGRARELLDRVLAQTPDDIYTLFLHARVSRDQNDYAREAEALEKIIALSKRLRQPAVHYHIYLAQAYARQGRASEAIANYQAALDSKLLTGREAKEVLESLENIKANIPKSQAD